MTTFVRTFCATAMIVLLESVSFGQSSTASISGVISDQNQAVIPSAVIVIRNSATGFRRSTSADAEGRYSFSDVPIGLYELTVEAPNFSKYLQQGIRLLVSQQALVSPALTPGGVNEVVNVNSDASLLNRATPEVATRFDERRLSELPSAPTRSVFNVLLSVPGVSQLGSGQFAYSVGISFSANGGRLRSNSFLLDGQDVNDPALTGIQMPLNNPDAIQEVRIVTNQFLPEYGHNASSVVNFIGKSGTHDFQGSVFWFHNDQYLNACSNLDKAAGFCQSNAPETKKRNAPFRLENQIGFTVGGPVIFPRFGEGGPHLFTGKNKTFFFVDFQHWTNRQLNSGVTVNGAPTAAGRAALQTHAGNRPQVQALLQFVPAGTPNGQSRTVTIEGGPTFDVELGDLSNSSAFRFDSRQGSVRIDHRLNTNNSIYGRFRSSDEPSSGAEQGTPPGLATIDNRKAKAAAIVWTTLWRPNLSNEATVAWTRSTISRDAEDARSKTIPSIQISDIGMTGASTQNRTAFGAATNLPQGKTNDTYQITDAISIFNGNHSPKFGIELRRTDVKSTFFPSAEGAWSTPR